MQPLNPPFTESDDDIRAALEEASVPVLMLSLVHMTGDPQIIRGRIRPKGTFLTEQQGMISPEDQAEIRAQALRIIKKYRDGGYKLPPPPSPALLHEMMSFLVGEQVKDEYIPMMLEETNLDGEDRRAPRWDRRASEELRSQFRVVVIGGGMSGLLAAIRLKQSGIPFTLIEKNESIGGTWHENRYPGCRVDVTNFFYSYSFEPKLDWNYFYAGQQELFGYFEHCADKYGIRAHIRFGTEVESMEFDETQHTWSVKVIEKSGRRETLCANSVISAVGQLNRPKLPDIAGMDTFAGESFHTARWNHAVDLKGRQVAVIGTGASAFQVVPAIAPEVGELGVFQRSSPWMIPNAIYYDKVGPGKKSCIRHLPYYVRWYRFLLFWSFNSWDINAFRIDPEWPHQDVSSSKVNHEVREMLLANVRQQLADRPDQLKKVIPDYVALGKRPLQDNGAWLAALKQPNVHLITDPIARIDPQGVVTRDGSLFPADIIVYATGFHAHKFLWPIRVIGRNGVVLEKQWGDTPSALVGVTIPNFPNLFCLYGPGTNLLHAGSIIFHAECQVRYVMSCLNLLLSSGHHSIECKAEANEEYHQRLRREVARMTCSHPTVKQSWYMNPKGEVTVISPWPLLDYWQMTAQAKPADYVLR
jgi:4-hydroxyacetophenone monooxygenase